MRLLLIVSVCIAIGGCNNTSSQCKHTPVHTEASTPRDIPLGLLGHPVGTALTIEGIRGEHARKSPSQFLVVDTVNGHKLGIPIDIDAKGPWLPKETRCILNGYETGSMVGTPPALLKGDQLDFSNQFTWQFLTQFVITSVVEPKSLEIE